MLQAFIHLVQALALLYVCYRILLAVGGLLPPKKSINGNSSHRFLVVIPARNEEGVIGGTVESLMALDYPASMRRVIVLADGCDDATAAVARSAGAEVLVRTGPASGKGAALQWLLAQPGVAHAEWDALVIFDSDSRPDTGFLRVMDGALERGMEAVQARTVNIEESGWWSQGNAVHQTQRNRLWHLARERVNLPAALTGTGVCLKREVLERVPFETTTITEDLEYSALLTLAGVYPRYLYTAVVRIEPTPNLSASFTQRLRWARGQIMTTLRLAPRLCYRALRQRHFGSFDMALYLGLPSLLPLQALLVAALGADVVLSGSHLFVPWATLAVVALSLALHPMAVVAEHRRYSLASWLGFAAIMLSWLPVACVAALTAYLRSWRPTPRSAPAAEVSQVVRIESE